MSDAYRAGKYHAETDKPSNLSFYTPGTFGWYDYLRGLEAGYNEQMWFETRVRKNEARAKVYEVLRDAAKSLLAEAHSEGRF
jgi:hypothetical protein